MGRPPKEPDERLVTLSVRVPKASLDLLDKIVDGERQFLEKRKQPVRGVHRSAAFRAIWELGEVEYLLQRVTLWVTRRTNRYTVEQAARVLGWRPQVLWRMLKERGIDVGDEPPATTSQVPPGAGPDAVVAQPLDPKFLV